MCLLSPHYLTVEGVDASKSYKYAWMKPGTTRMTMITVTALQQAVILGHAPIVEALIKAGANVDQATPSHSPPLFIACQNNNDKIVSLLLTAGANPNVARNDGATPLFIASQNGNDKIVSLLLAAQANPNITNNKGITPLFVASQRGHAKIVSLLLNTRADANIASKSGVTPLLYGQLYGATIRLSAYCLMLEPIPISLTMKG